jgi:hypothetical protein
VYVGVCRLVLHAEHCHSLKEKRAVIRRLKDRARSRLDLTVAEVAAQDTWQRIVLGFAVVGGDRRYIQDTIDKAIALVEEAGEARLLAADRDIQSFKAGEPLADIPAPESDQSWVPPEWLEIDGNEPE